MWFGWEVIDFKNGPNLDAAADAAAATDDDDDDDDDDDEDEDESIIGRS